MDEIEQSFLGTQADPTVEQAGNFDEIVRCAGCGYWILEGDEDPEGFCDDCVAVIEEGQL